MSDCATREQTVASKRLPRSRPGLLTGPKGILVAALILLAGSAGCSPHSPPRPYVGHSATTPESAKVTLECKGDCGRITNLGTGREINARLVERFTDIETIGTVSLDPGTYNIELLVCHPLEPLAKYSYRTVRLDAKPGHTYVVLRSAPVISRGLGTTLRCTTTDIRDADAR